MADKITNDQLAQLLDAAPEVRPAQTPHASAQPETLMNQGIISEVEGMLRFLAGKGLLDIAVYGEWLEVAFALKHSHGEAGFELWDRLASQAPNYDSEACRKKWDSIAELTDKTQQLTLATFYRRARTAGWAPIGAPEDDRLHFAKGVDPAAAVIQLAEEAGDEFWLDQHDKPHVSYTVGVGGEAVMRHVPVDSATYKGVLQKRYYEAKLNKVLPKEQANAAVSLLSYRAEEGQRHISSLRAAEVEGCIYVDLGRADGKAVAVTAEGWELVSNPPVRFVRGSRGELPEPLDGGNLSDFARHLNLPAADVVRAVAFMIGTFNDTGSYPILFVEGEQGTGKSVLADMIVGCTDAPLTPKGARLSFNADEGDFHLNARRARVLFFDNISNFSQDAADGLCRMATGAGSQRRKLYTDDEESRVVVIRPVVVTCIGLPSSRADLLSRALRVNAQPVTHRRSEATIWNAFDADRPKLLGFLFTCVSAALRNRDRIAQAVMDRRIGLPRMGDFAQFVEGRRGS